MGMPEICLPDPDGGCATPAPRVVSAVELGLQLMTTTDGTDAALLVPAWIFTVDGDAWPLVQAAVEPRYLGDGTDPGSGSGAGTGTAVPPTDPVPAPGTQPGTTEPGTTEPGGGSTGSGTTSGTVPAASARIGPDDRTLTVTWTGSPEGDAPCQARYDLVVEQELARTVRLTVVEQRAPQNGVAACTAIAAAYERTVVLDAPLGGREVVDSGGEVFVPAS